MMPPLLTPPPPYFLRTVKINIPLIYIVLPPPKNNLNQIYPIYFLKDSQNKYKYPFDLPALPPPPHQNKLNQKMFFAKELK